MGGAATGRRDEEGASSQRGKVIRLSGVGEEVKRGLKGLCLRVVAWGEGEEAEGNVVLNEGLIIMLAHSQRSAQPFSYLMGGKHHGLCASNISNLAQTPIHPSMHPASPLAGLAPSQASRSCGHARRSSARL